MLKVLQYFFPAGHIINTLFILVANLEGEKTILVISIMGDNGRRIFHAVKYCYSEHIDHVCESSQTSVFLKLGDNDVSKRAGGEIE